MNRFLLPASIAPLDLVGAKRRFDELLKVTPRLKGYRCVRCNLTDEEAPDECSMAPSQYFGHSWRRDEACLKCLACESTEGVQLESARTAYVKCEGLGGEATDPNAPIPLCRPCAEAHHSYWDAQWNELRAGQM